jgi:hypothetical protein
VTTIPLIATLATSLNAGGVYSERLLGAKTEIPVTMASVDQAKYTTKSR